MWKHFHNLLQIYISMQEVQNEKKKKKKKESKTPEFLTNTTIYLCSRYHWPLSRFLLLPLISPALQCAVLSCNKTEDYILLLKKKKAKNKNETKQAH